MFFFHGGIPCINHSNCFKRPTIDLDLWSWIQGQNHACHFPGSLFYTLSKLVFPLRKDTLYNQILSTVMEFTCQVRSKLLTFSLRKLSTSSFILNFSECISNPAFEYDLAWSCDSGHAKRVLMYWEKWGK